MRSSIYTSAWAIVDGKRLFSAPGNCLQDVVASSLSLETASIYLYLVHDLKSAVTGICSSCYVYFHVK